MKELVKRSQSHYVHRSTGMYCVNVTWFLAKIGNGALSWLLPDHILQKIIVTNDNGSTELVKRIGADRLEKRFGGDLPDKKQDFFPPRYNP